MEEKNIAMANPVKEMLDRSKVKWSIDNVQIKIIWEKVFQRAIAIAWALTDEEGGPDYRSRLSENSVAGVLFRDAEFRRIWKVLAEKGAIRHNNAYDKVEYPANMVTWIDTDARLRTDFMLTAAGLVLPWPEMSPGTDKEKEIARPTINRIREGYNLIGGLLPQENLVNNVDLAEYLKELKNWRHSVDAKSDEDKLDKNALKDYQYTDVDKIIADAKTSGNWLGGKDLDVFETNIAKVVALSWDNTQYREEFLGYRKEGEELVDKTRKIPNAAKRKFVDVSFPDKISINAFKAKTIKVTQPINWRVCYMIDIQSADIKSGKWEIVVVYPAPPNEAQVLDQLIIGAVSNPLYSYTWILDGPP